MNDLLLRAAVLAQSVPNPAPKPPPGSEVITTLISWAKWGAIAAGVLFIIVGAIAAGAAKASNNPTARIGAGRVISGGMLTAGIAAAAAFLIAIALQLAPTGTP